MTLTTLQIIVVVLVAIVLVLGGVVIALHVRIKKLTAGKNAKSLEDVITTLGKDIRTLEDFRDQTNNYLKNTEQRLRRSIQGVETIRFNAFKGTGEGGNQSFAIALLSENGDGTIISSLYTRDQVRVFAKPIKNFASEYELTGEEQDAIKRAIRS